MVKISVLALAGCVALAGCASAAPIADARHVSPTPQVVRVIAVTASAAPTTTDNDAFIAELTAAGLDTHRQVPVIGYGHELCSDLDAGETRREAGRFAYDLHDADALYAAAERWFCPQHTGI